MICRKISGKDHCLLTGRMTNYSYEESIKKLTLLPESVFAQLLPARIIAGENHLFTALETALDSFKSKTNFTRNPALELIARVLGKKQLREALKTAEFRRENLVLVVGSKDRNKIAGIKKRLGFAEKNFKLGRNRKELETIFSVSKRELDSLRDVENPLEEAIIERCALAALER